MKNLIYTSLEPVESLFHLIADVIEQTAPADLIVPVAFVIIILSLSI